MTANEKLNVLNIFLDKLKNNNLVCQQDVLSLEEMLGSNIFTNTKNIVYLSPTSSCIGVNEVKQLVEKELNNIKTESHISYTEYIQTLLDIKENLKDFKLRLIKFKTIRNEVISLLKDNNFTMYYKSKDGDDCASDVLCYLSDDSFFSLFKYYSYIGHLKKLCYLNEELGEKLLEEFDGIRKNLEETDEYETVVFNIFNILKEINMNQLFNLNIANIPINVFTLNEFLNTHSSINKIIEGVDLLLNYIESLKEHDSIVNKEQEHFNNELEFLNNIKNMLNDNKLSMLFNIVALLNEI